MHDPLISLSINAFISTSPIKNLMESFLGFKLLIQAFLTEPKVSVAP